MNQLLNVHHVRFAVKNVNKFVKLLRTQLQFYPYAARIVSSNTSVESTVVLRHQDVIVIIDQREESNELLGENEFCWGNTSYPVDTVCDLCLECSNIDKIVEKSFLYDKQCIQTSLTSHEDEFGTIKYAVLKPPIGNMQHTLVDLSNYTGPFLPGFKLYSNIDTTVANPKAKPNLIQTIDHVAFAVHMSQTDTLLNWYNHCMDFNRLIINEGENEKEGFVVRQGDLGLRLKAIFGPLQSLNVCNEPLSKFQCKIPKLVFAEALSDDCRADQVSHFLHMHQGPGLQHIAFSTNDIVETVSDFKKNGLNCILPPDSYYKEISKGEEIERFQYEVETLRTNNILLESHLSLPQDTLSNLCSFNTDVEDQIKQMNNTQWFIMQVFTSPVFQEKTLFFEIIQRFQTMSGFGAGNIGALWRAVQNELFQR